jgi:Domain of unknown function (DUF932)
MPHFDRLTTAAIQEAFSEEIAAMGGTVAEVFDDGERLFARSVLARVREVQRDDRVRDGVALRATDHEVRIHPYVFRQVCSNGAIIAQAVQSRRIEDVDDLAPEEAAPAIREAVRACCAEEAFEAVAEGMRSASLVQADLVMYLMPLLARLPDQVAAPRLLSEITRRFVQDADSSRFGFMNAVTSLARDTSDPDTRWRLEEFGGEVLAGVPATPAFDGARPKRRGQAVTMIA